MDGIGKMTVVISNAGESLLCLRRRRRHANEFPQMWWWIVLLCCSATTAWTARYRGVRLSHHRHILHTYLISHRSRHGYPLPRLQRPPTSRTRVQMPGDPLHLQQSVFVVSLSTQRWVGLRSWVIIESAGESPSVPSDKGATKECLQLRGWITLGFSLIKAITSLVAETPCPKPALHVRSIISSSIPYLHLS